MYGDMGRRVVESGVVEGMNLDDLANEYVSKAAVLAQKGDCYDAEGHLLYAVGTGNIMCLPAANVKPVVKAHWIWMGDTGDSRFMCSNCKGKENVPTVMGKPTVWEYCPNCGAEIEQEPTDPKSTFYDLLYEEGGANTT